MVKSFIRPQNVKQGTSFKYRRSTYSRTI